MTASTQSAKPSKPGSRTGPGTQAGRAGPWTARVLTLFPEMFPGPLGVSLAGKALKNGDWVLETVDIRDFAGDKHRTVDDAPFGGGPGMVMRPDVLGAAVDATVEAAAVRPGAGGADTQTSPVIYLSPRGQLLDQAMVREFTQAEGLILICGRFEGVDERVLADRGVREVSVGDYVLSGGEPAALVLIDAVVRLLPGVIGDPAGLKDESFETGLLEYPQYTRPQVWRDRAVPDVLLSGHHGRIEAWRRAEAERITKERRPDLWERYAADKNKAGSADRADDEPGWSEKPR